MACYYLIGSETQGATVTGVPPSNFNGSLNAAPPQWQSMAQSVLPTGAADETSPPQTQMIQLYASCTSGNVAATAQVYGSNDGSNWTAAGSTIAITSTALYGTAAQQLALPWRYWTAILTVLTGTGAQATVTMSA